MTQLRFPKRRPIIPSHIGLLLALVISVATGLLVVTNNYILLALVPLSVVAYFILKNPKFGLIVLFVSVMFQPEYVIRHGFLPLPRLVAWIPHAVMVMILVSIILNRVTSEDKKPLPKLLPGRLPWVLAAIILAGVISALLNEGSLLSAIMGMRGWFVLFGMIIIFRLLRLTKEEYIKLFRLLFFLAFLQIPIVILQFAYASTGAKGFDIMSGTFGNDDRLVTFLILCMLLALYFYLTKREKLLPLPIGVLLVVFIIPLIFSSNKGSWAFVPIVLIWMLLPQIMKNPRYIMPIIVFGSIIIIASALIFQSLFNEISTQAALPTSTEIVSDYLFGSKGNFYFAIDREQNLPRGILLFFIYTLISSSPDTWFFGFGPGAISESGVAGATGSLAQQYDFYNLNRGQPALTMAESGILGVLLVVWLGVEIYLSAAHESGRKDKTMLRVLQAFLILLLLQSIFIEIFRSPFMGFLIALLASYHLAEDGEAPTPVTDLSTVKGP